MKFSMPNPKKMLSYFKKPKNVFKTFFSVMIAVLVIDVIYLVRNVQSGNIGMCIFNVSLFAIVGYHSLLVLLAILKENYQKNVLLLIGIDLCSLTAYFLCPLYIVVAFLNNKVELVFPMCIVALICHFLFIPTIRSWIE
ncbi:MAG: hypothetical protein IJH12_09040 [Clostridia bacterium]|nr:hypothetical protein [Clostridia bacterium]